MLLTKLNFVYIIISLKLAYLLGHDYSLYLHNDLLWVRRRTPAAGAVYTCS